jgi:hypothetical protein
MYRKKIMVLSTALVMTSSPVMAIDFHKDVGADAVSRAANDDALIPDAPIQVRTVEPQRGHFPSPATMDTDIEAGLDDSEE